jgi:hypothetical protein
VLSFGFDNDSIQNSHATTHSFTKRNLLIADQTDTTFQSVRHKSDTFTCRLTSHNFDSERFCLFL